MIVLMATRIGVHEERLAPDFARRVGVTLRFEDGQELMIPIDDKRTAATLCKRLPTRYKVTIEGE